MTNLSKNKVYARVIKPSTDAGETGILDGDRFKYPGQSFWVQPILTAAGRKILALEWHEISERDYDSENYKIDASDTKKVYDYQKALLYGRCQHCNELLRWTKQDQKDHDDRFLGAVCCGVRYSMMPEAVRICAVFASPMSPDEIVQNDEIVDDDDFIEALKRLY